MANELLLKYGCNPNQKPSRIFMKEGGKTALLFRHELSEFTHWDRHSRE